MADKSKKKGGKGRFVGYAVGGVLAVVCVALIVAANAILPGYAQMINSYLGVEQGWDNSGVNTEGLDLEYNKADYSSREELAEVEHALDEQIAGEGIVMLENRDGSLPLAEGTTLSFVGGNSRLLGAGSQGILASTLGVEGETVDAVTPAMEAAGLKVNQTLVDFYANGEGSEYVMGQGSVSYGDDEDFSINECPLSVMQDAGVLDSMEGTTPVFVLRRVAGEGRDMPRSMYNHATNPEDQARSYIEPDSTELEILQYLNDNFDNTVLLITSNAAVELDWLEQFPNIRSVLFVPSLGSYGINALANVLTGAVNPSGRTTDTFAADASASPAAQNFGDYQYLDDEGNLTKYNYVSYEEGIYVGYRYYETRYEDAVLGQGNAGDYDYDAEVCYPFGYGLSYTTFDWSGFSTAWDGDECTATVTVTNTGDVAGKDVVELYAQSPYTDYDRENGVEKASVVLVGFAKTRLLEPGESQTVEVTFDESQLASYDYQGARTWILDAGTYYVTAGRNSHDAVNNVLAAKGAAVDGNAALVATYVPDNTEVDTTTYATDTLTGEEVTNRLDDAAGDLAYLTRSDWTGTFPTHDGEPTSQVSTWGNEINGDDGVSYTYGKVASDELIAQLDSTDSGNPDVQPWDGELTYGADNGLTLIEMRGLSYDDPLWEDLLDQLTPEDYESLIRRAGYGTDYIASVDKPAGTDADSTSGWSWGGIGMTFCNPMMVGQTWNVELAYQLGLMIGNESLYGGATGWYAPAMNIHRTPYSGRNGEYFSEDGFLSGAMASQEVKGAAEKGVYTLIKHFAFNDQENHRGDRNGQFSMATWLNEQSARELYLRPFEMCMKVGDVEVNYVRDAGDGTYENATTTIRACQGLMTAFNRIGATWVGGDYDLITGIVRNEWGFDGWIITDNADTGVFMNAGQMIESGADSKLSASDPTNTWSFDSSDATQYRYARDAVHHLLYVMANTHSMNGAMPGSTYSSGVGGMQKADQIRWGATAVGAVGLVVIAALVTRSVLKHR
ncbi:glycoside hydrolase family 3 C-terminal domain-containing protein [Olsenella profusa]|uniref:Glycoside hydrolase family 3 C-terminal domain-containing protein n=1 Tax=Olsenella profusa TaxID=138595 RepID=A0ABS2F196_9ACTN|nr:glycoside hydrolase family 3 N-terminal domain-containing protein [Olsenella profusa]MBM6774749.1 glycoside hydrolase family 3 C-terminal domain-containing protein [Olsenella profusa]